MSAAQIILAIKKLPLNERLLIMEELFKEIRSEVEEPQQKKDSLKAAAEQMKSFYENDPEGNICEALDAEDFYEA